MKLTVRSSRCSDSQRCRFWTLVMLLIARLRYSRSCSKQPGYQSVDGVCWDLLVRLGDHTGDNSRDMGQSETWGMSRIYTLANQTRSTNLQFVEILNLADEVVLQIQNTQLGTQLANKLDDLNVLLVQGHLFQI